jgi:thiol-disulfide isomerase/thioredoxin
LNFEKNVEDTLLGYNYYFYTERDRGRYISFYDGDQQIGLNMHDSVAYLKDLRKYVDYKAVSNPFFSESILSIGKWLSRDSLGYTISNLEVRDTIISSKKCKLFSFTTTSSHYNWYYWETVPRGRYEVEIAFSIKSKTPVYLRSKMYFQGSDYALSTVGFSNLIDKRYSIEKLSIESVPEYYQWGIRQTKLALNTKGPNFNLPNTNGDSFELSTLIGRYVIVQFGWIGCGPCVKSIPLLNQIEEKYASIGLEVIGVNLNCGSQEKVRSYQERHNINYSFLWSHNDSMLMRRLNSTVLRLNKMLRLRCSFGTLCTIYHFILHKGVNNLISGCIF